MARTIQEHPPLKLLTLGELALSGPDGAHIEHPLSVKQVALLAFLAVEQSNGSCRRDQLATMLWPELDQTRSRTALRKALHQLRAVLGRDAIVTRGHEVVQLDSALVWCDARELKLRAADGNDEGALALVAGEFLPAFHVRDASEFMLWVDAERHRLGSIARDCALRLAERGVGRTPVAAARWAARAVECAPLEERPNRILIDRLDESGDGSAAVLAYERYADRLARELEIAPSHELQLLAGRLRERARLDTAPADPPSDSLMPPRLVETSTVRVPRRRSVHTVAVALGVVVFLLAIIGLGTAGIRNAWTVAWTSPTLRLGARTPINTTAELKVDAAISPDGRRVAFAAGPPNGKRVYVQSIEGGAPLLISAGLDGDHRWPAWSPDGGRILFSARPSDPEARFAAYVVSSLGGRPRLVIDSMRDEGSSLPGLGALTPAWSPDGQRIAYGDGTGIFIQDLAGGVPERILSGAVHTPAFSPDGRRLAFVSGAIWHPVIFSVTPSAVCVTTLSSPQTSCITDSVHTNVNPVWRGDGRSLVYASSASSEGDLFEQRLTQDGRAVGPAAQLTTGLGVFAFSMTSDESRGVYTVLRRRSNIWMAPVETAAVAEPSRFRLITKEAEFIEGLDLSPDGEWLLYDSNFRGNQDIYLVGADGGEAVALTSNPAADFQPRWSPDGREVAYYSARSGGRDLRQMTARGSDDRSITAGGPEEGYPNWSPDGKALVFHTAWGSPPSLGTIARSSDGSWAPPRSLSLGTSAKLGGMFPTWSRDGRWIVFRAGVLAGMAPSIWLVSSSGGEPRRLVGPETLGGTPEFVTYGRASDVVYVHASDTKEGSSFWQIPIDGGTPRMVLKLPAPEWTVGRPEFSTDGRRLFFTRAAHVSAIWVMNLKP